MCETLLVIEMWGCYRQLPYYVERIELHQLANVDYLAGDNGLSQ